VEEHEGEWSNEMWIWDVAYKIGHRVGFRTVFSYFQCVSIVSMFEDDEYTCLRLLALQQQLYFNRFFAIELSFNLKSHVSLAATLSDKTVVQYNYDFNSVLAVLDLVVSRAVCRMSRWD